MKLISLMSIMVFLTSPMMGMFERSKAKMYFPEEPFQSFAVAAATGNIKALQKFVAQGMDINTKCKDGMTVLCWAPLRQNKKGFQFLLENGADPNIFGEGENVYEVPGFAAIHYTAMHKDIWWLKTALRHGGDINFVLPTDGQRRSLIFVALMHRRPEHVRFLMRSGADLYKRDRWGATPALVAAIFNDYELILDMLHVGYNPLTEDDWGNTLVDSIRKGNITPENKMYEWREKVINFLASKGIDLGDRSTWLSP